MDIGRDAVSDFSGDRNRDFSLRRGLRCRALRKQQYDIAGLELDAAFGQYTGAKFRALQILHDRDRSACAFGGLADVGDQPLMKLVRAVTEIQARDIHPGCDER